MCSPGPGISSLRETARRWCPIPPGRSNATFACSGCGSPGSSSLSWKEPAWPDRRSTDDAGKQQEKSLDEADDDGRGHDQAQDADDKADQDGNAVLLDDGKCDDGNGAGRQPVGEGNGQSEDQGENEDGNADQALAGPRQEHRQGRGHETLRAPKLLKSGGG